MQEAAVIARRMWTMFEPVHSLTYFTPEAAAAYEAAGLRGFWRGYFAGRSAPVGQVGPAPVVAAFFSFAPVMVARALPSVWDLITPAAALAVREAGAVAALRRLLELPGGAAVPEFVIAAADRLAAVAGTAEPAGRVLGGSNLALPVPSDPLARLWQAATVLREHRGDGHTAALVAADLDGAEALALRDGLEQAAAGQPGPGPDGGARARMQPIRGWTDEQWDAAVARLAGRGLLRPGGTATPAGAELRAAIEEATDAAAARPWASLSGSEADELAAWLLPVARACATVVPYPNPIGVPAAG
jgi:hypothetical protein